MKTDFVSVDKNSMEQIRIGWQDYNGHSGLSVRTWFKASVEGNYIPTKKGVFIPTTLVEAFTRTLMEFVGRDTKIDTTAS